MNWLLNSLKFRKKYIYFKLCGLNIPVETSNEPNSNNGFSKFKQNSSLQYFINGPTKTLAIKGHGKQLKLNILFKKVN